MEKVLFPKKTHLYNLHVQNKAKIVNFSGWLLPVQFSSIIKEHEHTRNFNTIFDISHMGEFLITGKGAEKSLEYLLTCKVSGMKNGKCRYAFLLNENGGVVDDSILYKIDAEHFMLVVNAGRTEIDYNWLKNNFIENTEIRDISTETAKIDLQGPLSPVTASKCFPDINFPELKPFSFTSFEYDGHKIIVSATGYTGETGYEFFIPADYAEKIWKRFLKNETVIPAGLGARDSLRLEKGYSLYGHELSEAINPFEANLQRFISLDEKSFIGSKALKQASKQSPSRILVPFLCEGRRAAREGYRVISDGIDIGYVTSGAYSPSLKKGIGLCLIDSDKSSVGSLINCIEANISINAEIVELPFV